MQGSAARPVVIATHNDSAEVPGQINHFVRVRAVANDVAKIPDDVMLRSGSENCLESWQIGMNVGDQKCAHVNPSVVLLFCRHFSESARYGIRICQSDIRR
jgi:hypothetical protein